MARPNRSRRRIARPLSHFRVTLCDQTLYGYTLRHVTRSGGPSRTPAAAGRPRVPRRQPLTPGNFLRFWPQHAVPRPRRPNAVVSSPFLPREPEGTRRPRRRWAQRGPPSPRVAPRRHRGDTEPSKAEAHLCRRGVGARGGLGGGEPAEIGVNCGSVGVGLAIRGERGGAAAKCGGEVARGGAKGKSVGLIRSVRRHSGLRAAHGVAFV